jgi:type II secretory pathway pseudopilin PulG
MRTSNRRHGGGARGRSRIGFTIIEVTLALTTLLFAAILLAQSLLASSQQRKLADQRRLALEELSNRLERVMAAKWEEVNAAAIENQDFSPRSQEKLPAAKLTASVTVDPDAAGGKRVRLEISWEQQGQRVKPLGLTGWKHRPPEARP